MAPPSLTPTPVPAIAAAPPTAVANERSGQDDSASVAQSLLQEVRKAAATGARPAPAPKVKKKKVPPRVQSPPSTSDSSGAEMLRKRRRGRNFGRSITLPFYGWSGEVVTPEAQRPCGARLARLLMCCVETSA